MLPLSATVLVLALAFVAAGCGNGGGQRAETTAATTPRSSACKLNSAQRRGIARARADIRRLRRIEASMQTYSDRGGPNQNVVTGQFLMDLGTAHVPLNVYSRLLHEAKAATRLCGDCSQGLEAAEPVLGTRAHERCG